MTSHKKASEYFRLTFFTIEFKVHPIVNSFINREHSRTQTQAMDLDLDLDLNMGVPCSQNDQHGFWAAGNRTALIVSLSTGGFRSCCLCIRLNFVFARHRSNYVDFHNPNAFDTFMHHHQQIEVY